MDKKRQYDLDIEFSLPQPSPEDLRGRQSVRATFKLSSKAIEALSIVAVHLGIKQKSLFDHLIDDVKSLNLIAREIEAEEFNTLNRIQKTFVISRKTLASLDETSREFKAPRDALVEYSIQRLLPVIAKERQKHRKRKEILDEINSHFEQGLSILRKSKTLLGEDDPVHVKLEAAMMAYANARDNIEHFIEKCKIIEAF